MASNYWTHWRFLWSHCIVDVCLHKETVVPLKWILPKPAVRTASHQIYTHSLVNTYRRTLSSSASSSFLHLVVFPSWLQQPPVTLASWLSSSPARLGAASSADWKNWSLCYYFRLKPLPAPSDSLFFIYRHTDLCAGPGTARILPPTWSRSSVRFSVLLTLLTQK